MKNIEYLEIYQGSNAPIVLTFDGPITGVAGLSASLHNMVSELKHWALNDVKVSGDSVILPLTEEETLLFESGSCELDFKTIDSHGDIEIYTTLPVMVVYDFDKSILGGDGG